MMDDAIMCKVSRSCRLKLRPSSFSKTVRYISKKDSLLILNSISNEKWVNVSIKQFELNTRGIQIYTWIDGWVPFSYLTSN